MHRTLAILSSALLILLTLPAQGRSAENGFPYTLQVASFPDAALAGQFAERLSNAGEAVGVGTFALAGRGIWTRVYIGSFKTTGEARDYGNALIRRKLIAEYIVKTSSELQALGRPLTVSRAVKAAAGQMPNAPKSRTAYALTPQPAVHIRGNRAPNVYDDMSKQLAGLFLPLYETSMTLPVAGDIPLDAAPAIEVEAIPRPDPVHLAFNLISQTHGGRGGLWVAGDREEALARLRYIVGDKLELITLGDNGAVHINYRLLAEAAGADGVSAEEAPLRIAEYITENEGLLLLVQMIQGTHRYLLHIAGRAPVLGGVIDVVGGVNLDNNYDSRINPYRRNARKLDIERPPKGFDALIAINPAARWFNLRANEFVSAGQITFHELAEAHAKVELNLDYLEQGNRMGAHGLALEREQRLQSQRPSANLVLTLGSNRLFKSEEEVRNFTAQTGQGAGHPR
ncbi:MAG TPA: SPOR domain-containing protein [Blastocatellia bacterium]|nr:SPOR domain-containing protein [Blastocatellia bacterium]